jgi:hypothetical protein
MLNARRLLRVPVSRAHVHADRRANALITALRVMPRHTHGAVGRRLRATLRVLETHERRWFRRIRRAFDGPGVGNQTYTGQLERDAAYVTGVRDRRHRRLLRLSRRL